MSIAMLLCAPVTLSEPVVSMVSVLLPPVRLIDLQVPLSVYVALPCKMFTTGSLPQSHVAPLPARNTLSAFAVDELAIHAMAAIHTTSLVMVPPDLTATSQNTSFASRQAVSFGGAARPHTDITP